MKSGFCESENQIGSESLQVSEVSHKSWKFAIRSIIKRLPTICNYKALTYKKTSKPVSLPYISLKVYINLGILLIANKLLVLDCSDERSLL